jgi:hypothetical protein
MRGIYYWGCHFDSFFPLLLSLPYYIQTSSAPFPCSPCHLSLLACRWLCIIVRALDICVRPPFSAFCTHITLRRRSKRFRRFKRWVWSPCGTHAALTRPTGRQRGPPCRTHFFFAMSRRRLASSGRLGCGHHPPVAQLSPGHSSWYPARIRGEYSPSLPPRWAGFSPT